MDRLLRDSAGQLDLLTYDSAGAPVDIDGTNPPTVVVTDSAGTVVPGFSGVRDSAGVYHAAIPANFQTLDTYSIAWNFANGQSRYTAVELVGGFLFTLAQARAFDTAMADVTRFPNAVLAEVRAQVEDVFEDPNITARAFRPRGRRILIDGSGGRDLQVPDFDIIRVISASIGGTAVNLATVFPYSHRVLRLSSGSWSAGTSNVTVLYEYGFPTTPAKVRREALQLAKSYLLESPIEGGRATAVFSDVGGYRLSIAGRDGWTGIPSVDACLQQYSMVPAGLVG